MCLATPQLRLKNDVVLRLGAIVCGQHALIGRASGTCAVTAKISQSILEFDKQWEGQLIVQNSRRSDTSRYHRSCKRTNNEWVSDHLPQVLYHDVFEPHETEVQYCFAQYFNSSDPKVDYEKRNLNVLTVMVKLYPIKDMNTTHTLLPVIKDIFKCYRWTFEGAKAIHGDISENNLMYRTKEDGTIYGVLCDFDLASKFDQMEFGPSSKQRTGTRPFMAIDLLDSKFDKHLYRHDLESLLYVITVLIYRSPDESLPENDRFTIFPDIKTWFLQPPMLLKMRKFWFFGNDLPSPPSAFEDFIMPLSNLQDLFFNGYFLNGKRNKGKPGFDDATLGGHVDFEKFDEALQSI